MCIYFSINKRQPKTQYFTFQSSLLFCSQIEKEVQGMEDLGSIFIYEESDHELRQKLVDARLELETMKNVKVELYNLLMMAYQERDEARFQVQKLMNKLMPSTPIPLQNVFGGVQHQDNPLTMFPSAKANPSITESNSLSHGSPPVDSFFDNVSSPQEFSHINLVDNNNNNNMVCLNQQHLVQDFNLVSSENPASDPASAVIECLAKDKVLPQKGNLLQAVIDAGPLLQTLLLAGPLPSWQNPPPLGDIKVPTLNIKEHCTPIAIEPNSFADNSNLLLKPKLPSLQSSNALSTCSASMLNFSGHSHSLGSWNNPWKFRAPSRKRQRHH